MAETLADLPFIYIYFQRGSAEKPLYRSNEKGQGQPNRFVPEAFIPAIGRLSAAIEAVHKDASETLLEFEGIRCRVSRQTMADGTDWFCVRRITTTIPGLSELGYAPHIANHLHGLGLRNGLILLAGPSGHGKTTTAASLLVDYLSGYGGTAVAVESPIEYNLKGRYGDLGQCFQIEPTSNDDWAVCLKRALTAWAPGYIFAGEIKTPKVAEILVRAATTGHTVITTVDAGTPEDALSEVLFLAEQAMGPSATGILAQGIMALLFQTIREDGPFIRYLFTEENAPGDPIRTLIRENKVTMISTYIDRIAARLSNQPTQMQPLPPITKPLPPLPKKK
jgi:twitching motility protein PilT